MDAAIHNLQTKPHGWVWYEMGFHIHWTLSGGIKMLCFDVPEEVQEFIQVALSSDAARIDFHDPFSPLLIAIREILTLYNTSVWAIRNHICQCEAVRSPLSCKTGIFS